VPFTDVRLNNGSAFNGTTGRFTAPIAGTYFFFGSLLSRSAGNMNCQIRINGGVYVYSEDTRTSNFGNCYPKCIAYLNVNDFADINASYATYGSIYDYFGGYLLG
jgi:hypothetical protein